MAKKHCQNCHDVEPMYRQAVAPAVHWMVPCHPMFVPNQPPVPRIHCHGPRMCPPPPMHNPCTYNGFIQAPHPYIYWMNNKKVEVAAGDNVTVNEVVAPNGDITYVVNADMENQTELIRQLQADMAAQADRIAGLSASLDETNIHVSQNESLIMGLDTRMDDTEAYVQSNSVRIQENADEISSAKSTLDDHASNIQANTSNIDSLADRMSTAEQDIVEHETEIQTLDGRVTATEQDIDTINNTELTITDMPSETITQILDD